MGDHKVTRKDVVVYGGVAAGAVVAAGAESPRPRPRSNAGRRRRRPRRSDRGPAPRGRHPARRPGRRGLAQHRPGDRAARRPAARAAEPREGGRRGAPRARPLEREPDRVPRRVGRRRPGRPGRHPPLPRRGRDPAADACRRHSSRDHDGRSRKPSPHPPVAGDLAARHRLGRQDGRRPDLPRGRPRRDARRRAPARGRAALLGRPRGRDPLSQKFRTTPVEEVVAEGFGP